MPSRAQLVTTKLTPRLHTMKNQNEAELKAAEDALLETLGKKYLEDLAEIRRRVDKKIGEKILQDMDKK